MYPSGDLGEVFIELSKDGTTVKGLVGAVVTILSIALQYGVPLYDLVEKMIYRRFEPSGWVKGDGDVRNCTSVIDYIFKHLAFNHLPEEDLVKLGLKRPDATAVEASPVMPTVENTTLDDGFCPNCGTQLRKLGSCSWCSGCSWQSGACS